ncbi:MAG: hypothetical protein E7254_12360 [Lachnospiraceae bacterium]|nr:hypothetical protein [Lachnospiraceae bacterium]
MEKIVVFLFEVYPVETYAKRYDFHTLIENGYQIHVCNMASVISEWHAVDSQPTFNNEKIEYFCFKTKDDFKKYIYNLGADAFIWSTFQLTAEYYWVFNVISRHRYGFICNVDYVFPRTNAGRKKKRHLPTLSWHRYSNAILLRMPKKYIPVRKADAVITYGIDDVQRKLNNVLYDKHTVVELTNTIDYCESIDALMSGRTLSFLPDRYILFIDEFLPFHPDAIKLGQIIDAERYYFEVESFLHRLERLLGCPIIVAAHPKADYSKHPECYKGMKIVQFKTAELISNATIVVTHLSLAIGMILASKKPYMVITTNDLNDVIDEEGVFEDQEADIQRKAINISHNLADSSVEKYVDEAFKIGETYYEEQLRKYKLPDNHPNALMSLGQIMDKAMRRVEDEEKSV